jgi:hypothetical protein
MDASVAPPLAVDGWRRDRRFFTGMALAAAAVVFAGFAPTYFLKRWFGTPPLPIFLHIHGLLMTTWLILLLVQTRLVAMKRTDLHRRLGIAGAILAAAIVVMSVVTSIMALRIPIGLAVFDPTAVIVSLANMVLFAGIIGVALLLRRNPDAHKRLIFIATASLLTAPLGRLIGSRIFVLLGPTLLIPVAVGSACYAFVAAMIVYDLKTRRRVHPALVWGGLALPLTLVLVEAVRYTSQARDFVVWLQSAN